MAGGLIESRNKNKEKGEERNGIGKICNWRRKHVEVRI